MQQAMETTGCDESAVIIELSYQQMTTAAMIGVRRQISAMAKRRQHWGVLPSSETEAFDNHIVGCHGEMAVAKYLDRYWSGAIGDFAAADVGARIQVRASNHPRANLCLHPPPSAAEKRGDKPGDYFICARVLLPAVHLMGWMRGAAAQQRHYWRELQPGRPAYVVPVDDLSPMPELRSITNMERAA